MAFRRRSRSPVIAYVPAEAPAPCRHTRRMRWEWRRVRPEPSLRGGQNVEARDEMGGQCRLVIPTRRLSRLSQIRNSNSKLAGTATCVPPGLLSFEIDARSFDTHL